MTATEKDWATKVELAQRVADRLNIYKEDVVEVVDAYLDEIVATLADRQRVVLRGFGRIETRELNERRIPHPVTGERVRAPARVGVRFQPSEVLVAKINGWET